jgi:SAM-dependent methyltransferase
MNSLVAEYDRSAERWTRWRPTAHFRQVFAQSVLKVLNDFPRSEIAIVDAGCGHGTWLKDVCDCCNARGLHPEITGIDLAPRRLAIARQQFGNRPNVKLVNGDLLEVGLPAQVDLLYCMEVFQCLPPAHHGILLEKWAKALTPGGAIIIVDKERWSWHAMKINLQLWSGRFGRRLWGRHRSFEEDSVRFLRDTRYPSFRCLRRVATSVGLSPQVLLKVSQFRGLILSKPGGKAPPMAGSPFDGFSV